MKKSFLFLSYIYIVVLFPYSLIVVLFAYFLIVKLFSYKPNVFFLFTIGLVRLLLKAIMYWHKLYMYSKAQ